MLDLDETAWSRGLADSRKWLGYHSVRGVGFALAILAAWYVHSQEGKAGWTAGATALAAVGYWLVLIVLAFVTAPARQRNEARDSLRAAQAGPADPRRFPTLPEFYERGERLYADKVDAALYPDWRARLISWTENTERCLSVDYGQGEVELFDRTRADVGERLSWAVNPEHDLALKTLAPRLRIIRAILDRPD